jgi:hypothetical protein
MHYSAESLKELQVLLLVPVDRSNECPIHVCDNGSSSNTFPSFPEDFTNLRVLLRLKHLPNGCNWNASSIITIMTGFEMTHTYLRP